MPALHHRAPRYAALCIALFAASAPGLAWAQSTPAASRPGEAEAPLEEMGITSTEVAPAEAGESAQAVPYIGTHEVWCTQGNPSPGICGSHHDYPAIDLGMPVGTQVYAVGPGVIHELRRSDSDARGLYLTIRHPDGIYSRYLHLSSITVTVGQAVATGTPIGRSGNTGSSSAPHLHYDEQRPFGTPKSVGTMTGIVPSGTATYPDAFGHTSWSAVRFGTDMRNDGYAPDVPVTPHQWGGPTLATGDFDGDGFDDLASGVPGKDSPEAVDAGAVTVMYGTGDGLATEGSRQFVPGMNGLAAKAETSDLFGAAVAAGDFNGDGYDDLAVGAPREDTATPDSGAVVVLAGSESGLDPSRSSQWWSGPEGRLAGVPEAGDQLGAALTAGDFNGDGFDELALGAPGEDAGGSDVGAVVVARGGATGLSPIGGRELLSGRSGLAGLAQSGDLAGAALTTGDFNADRFDDLAIGSPGQDVGRAANAGQVTVVDGSANWLDQGASRQIRAGIAGVAGRSERDDVFGAALAAGDTDAVGDQAGADDLVVGVPGEDAAAVNDGAVALLLGSPTDGLSGASSRQFWSGSPTSTGVPASNNLFGTSVALGELDGDGESEILVGVPGAMVGPAANAGTVVTIGTQDGVWSSDSTDVAGTSEPDDRLGRTVVTGDFNGDGHADLASSAPTEAVSSATETGSLTVLFGSAGVGLTAAGSRHLVRGQHGLVGTARTGDQFGGLLPPYLF